MISPLSHCQTHILWIIVGYLLIFIIQCGIRRRRPPVVPYLCPFRLHLSPGRVYRFCTCGRSKDQPWCDDTHESEKGEQPMEFEVEKGKEQTWYWLCGCKYSTSMPYCDGSHIHAIDGYEEEEEAKKNNQQTNLDATSSTCSNVGYENNPGSSNTPSQ